VVLLRGNIEVAKWRLATRERADLAVVDELARLALVARRLGCSIRLSRPSTELCELLELAGLDGVVAGAAGLEAGGEVEVGEEVGVEEVVVPDDPRA
jgi:hypothetical protein